MRSGVDNLGKDSLGLCQGKMGYIRKKCWFYMQKIAFYFKPIQIIIIKRISLASISKIKKTKCLFCPYYM